MYYRDPDKNRVELQEAGEAMADLLCIPLPQGKNPWDMHVPGSPTGRPRAGEAIPPDGGCVLGRIDEYRSVD